MSINGEGPSKCTRKTALSIFFVFELFAFTFSLIALLSPSWQYVYLENGRTEHHHGLWLDCKRDYSHEYGRTRDYYETLYRLDKQIGPFDQFFLPSLNCVYKFDYYIDTEDLYDHNHDENRLQDDANQHLFLPWKIAALAALGLAILAAGTALLLCICAFCHRTFICASTVLVSIAAFLSTVGLIVFYIWANYQDNNIIKEDDATYQQFFGWAVYMQAIGTVLHFLSSFLGCIGTSIAFHKGKAKLVKIEVVDGDSSTLLDDHQSQQFKRSFSAIYKVDSTALRRWEKEYMSKLRPQFTAQERNFKRAASMPNVKKGRRLPHPMQNSSILSKSSTNVFVETSSSIQTATTNTLNSSHRGIPPSPPKPALKPALKQSMPVPPLQVSVDDHDVTYEYLPCDVISFGKISQPSESGTAFGVRNGTTYATRTVLGANIQPQVTPETSVNVYDKVYEHISLQASSSPDEYEQPNSVRARNSLSSFGDELSGSQSALRPISSLSGSAKSVNVMRLPPKCTLIDDVIKERPSTADPTSIIDRWQAESPEFRTSAEVLQLRGSDWRMEQKRELLRKEATEYREVIKRPVVPPKPIVPLCSSPPKAEKNVTDFAVHRTDSTYFSDGIREQPQLEPDTISINTFNVGTFTTREGQRSITNLTFRPYGEENIEAFERPDSTDLSSLNSFVLPKNEKPTPLMKTVLSKASEAHVARNGFLSTYQQSNIGAIPIEVERSVGSSTNLENDTISESPVTYLKEAELRLNLFMNGVAPLDAVHSDGSMAASSTKESSVTTV